MIIRFDGKIVAVTFETMAVGFAVATTPQAKSKVRMP
jgi:hypothetical protein